MSGDAPRRDSAPTDYRNTRKRHERRTVLLAMLVLAVGGDVLVGLVYGLGAMLGALPWLMLGAGGILGLYYLFVWMERWADR